MKTGLASLALALLFSGCAAMEQEEDIPLSEVPDTVLDAARAAVPGIDIDEAELEREYGQVVYELSGTVEGVEYEIEVGEDGKVLEVERD